MHIVNKKILYNFCSPILYIYGINIFLGSKIDKFRHFDRNKDITSINNFGSHQSKPKLIHRPTLVAK